MAYNRLDRFSETFKDTFQKSKKFSIQNDFVPKVGIFGWKEIGADKSKCVIENLKFEHIFSTGYARKCCSNTVSFFIYLKSYQIWDQASDCAYNLKSDTSKMVF